MAISTSDTKPKFLLLSIFLIPVIIYFYFINWKTTIIYGDDLSMYINHLAMNGFYEKINLPFYFEKFRPIHGLSSHFIMEVFSKNMDYYYLFNIGVQTINTLVIALILNLFLRSPYFALLFSLMLGLSRFSLYSMTQLMNGGALEGLAITFFLLSLYFLLKVLVENDQKNTEKPKQLISSIVFANLCLYTHERYIVLLPFIAIAILVFPTLYGISIKKRIVISFLALFSIFMNVFLKTIIFEMPFFVGTAGTNITFSMSTAFGFLVEAIMSIFQLNDGHEYLVGITYKSLRGHSLILAVVVPILLISSFTLYLITAIKNSKKNQSESRTNLYVFIALVILLGMCLAPAISTIRLEQRWLQASFAVFVVLIAIALKELPITKALAKNYIYVVFAILFIWTDFNYLYKGAYNLFFVEAERTVVKFKDALDKNVIRSSTTTLYIWEKEKSVNVENAIKWYLIDGAFFDFYQKGQKELAFVDSIYSKSDDGVYKNSFPNFNKNTDQIIYINNNVIDLTPLYMKDSLQDFIKNGINNPNYMGEVRP